MHKLDFPLVTKLTDFGFDFIPYRRLSLNVRRVSIANAKCKIHCRFIKFNYLDHVMYG